MRLMSLLLPGITKITFGAHVPSLAAPSHLVYDYKTPGSAIERYAI